LEITEKIVETILKAKKLSLALKGFHTLKGAALTETNIGLFEKIDEIR